MSEKRLLPWLRSRRRWLLFGLALIGLGFLLNELLPPRPRCKIVFPSRVGFGFLSPDGSMLTTPPVSFNNFLGGGMGPGSYQLWDTGTGALRKTYLEGKELGCYGLSPDMRYLAVVEGPKNPDGDGHNASSVLHLVDLNAETHHQRPLKGICDATRLQFSPRGTYVDVSGLKHNKRAATRQLVQSATGALLKSFDKFSELRAFSPDEKLLLLDIPNPRETVVWNVSSGQGIGSFAGVEEGSFSPDGKTLVLWCSQGKMEFWDISEGRIRRRASDLFAEGSAAISRVSLTFSPDSRFLVAEYRRRIPGGDAADKIVLWDVPSGARLWTRKRCYGEPRFLPDSSDLVVSHFMAEGWAYEVMDARTGSLRHAISSIDGSELDPAHEFTKNNRFLAMASTHHLPGILEGVFGDWWAFKGHRRRPEVRVIAVGSGRDFTLVTDNLSEAWVSEDGRTLLTQHDEAGHWSICCWDLPLRAPLIFVIGIPAGLGLAGIFWNRRRPATRPAKTSTWC